jgi:glycosyltransferase involved in cell wall biosynthesis
MNERLRIGFFVPALIGLGNPNNGILVQASHQAEALRELGHEVTLVDPWVYKSMKDLHVLQFFLGGLGLHGIERWAHALPGGILVFAPIIDSNVPNWRYRMATLMGSWHSRITTVPGVLAQQARGSDLIVCRSRHELERVCDGLGVQSGKVAVVLNGTTLPQVSDARVEAVQREHDLPERFLLHVAAYTQSRKNTLQLAQAACELDLPLVIAGYASPGPILDALQRIAQTHGKVRLLGPVDVETRNALYRLCHVFCLPSLHEGTGLAALEAGATGARVVITSSGGAPDYFEDMASYVDPGDGMCLRAAILKEWSEPRNTRLSQHIASRLSWRSSANTLVEQYRLALARKRLGRE